MLEDEAEGVSTQTGALIAVKVRDVSSGKTITARARPIEQTEQVHQAHEFTGFDDLINHGIFKNSEADGRSTMLVEA